MKYKLAILLLVLLACIPILSQKRTHAAYRDVDAMAFPALTITQMGVTDYACQPNPGNPPTGKIRIYCDSGTGLLTCLSSTGTNVCPSGGGGGTAAGPVGTVQGTDGAGNFTALGETDNGTTFTVKRNSAFLGPSPYTDVTVASAIRSVTPDVAPQVPGVTVTMGLGSNSAAISTASTFQNNDGVIIPGAGPACSLSSPVGVTVTPSIAAGPTGTGFSVPAPAGSTAYSYELTARDKLGCYTAASSAGSTSTGTSSLGAQSLTITGFTQATNVVTATVSSTATLAVGAYIYVNVTSTTDAGTFGGWYYIASIPNGTTFTYVTGNLVIDGAPPVSASGGTAFYWYLNHVTWTPNTAPYEYYAYGRTSAAYNLIGQTLPNNIGAGFPITSWDDYGATMMGTQNFAFWIPTTAPGSPLPDPLITTIVSGAATPTTPGTTTLTLNATAGTAVSGQMILLDEGVEFAALAASAPFGGPLLYFPPGTYVFNSHTDIPSFVSIELADANIRVNETLQFDGSERIFGMIGPQAADAQSFGWPTGGSINAGHGYPGVWDTDGSGEFIEGIRLTYSGDGGTAFLLDGGLGGSQGHFKNINFIGASGGAPDYMGMPLVVRGGFWYDWDHVSINTGPGQAGGGFIGSTSTPAAYYKSGGSFSNLSVQDRGLFIFTSGSGGGYEFYGESRDQGGITPFLTLFTTGACVGGSVNFYGGVEMDTTQQNVFANAASCYLGSVIFNEINIFPALGYGVVTGNPITYLGGTVSGQNSAVVNGYNFTNNAVFVTGLGQFMYPITNNTAPTIAVSAGGSIPVGVVIYAISVVDAAGNQSTLSPTVTGTTTSGNQTVTVTPPAAPNGAIGWIPYRNNAMANIPGCGSIPLSFSATFVDTFSFTCATSPPSVNRAGSQSISAAGISGTQINLLGGGFKDAISGTFTAPRTQALQDVTDTFVYRNSTDTLTLKTLTSPVLNGTMSGTGLQGTDTKVMSAGTVSGTAAALCTDANGGATTSGCPSSASFYQTLQVSASSKPQEPALNLIAGTNVTITCTDTASTSTNCTFTATNTGATAWSALTASTNSNAGSFISTGNVWDFSGATSLKTVVGAGAAPTVSGIFAYDSTANKWAFGQNGSTVNFGLSSSACSAHQWVSTPATGVATATCTQPAFTDISGVATTAQLPTNAVVAVTNDTNVTGSIAGQTLTLGWTGTLAKVRTLATTVYTDQTNTFSTGTQDFSGATALKVVIGAGITPTTSGLIGYDSTANKFVFGQNGATVSFGLASSSACAASQWVSTPATAIAIASCTQPAFSNISGSVAASQLPNPTATTLGGIESYAAVAHQWINTISTSGVPSSAAIGTNDVSPNQYSAGGGTAQAQTATLSPAATALVAGLQVYWLPSNANSGAAPTLAVNGLTAKSITKLGNSTPLVANDLTTNAIAFVVYDGTEWQLQNPQTSTGGGSSITLQTIGINNITQTALNFVTSTTNAIGGTITPFNLTGSQESFELTGRIVPVGGGTGISSPTAHSLLIAEGASNMNLLTSPSTNGACVVFFNVSAGAAVDPTCGLQGVPVNAQAGSYPLVYSDRLNYIKESGTSTSTLTLPQVTGNTASNFQFVTQNLNSGNETITANAADKIDGSGTGGSAALLPTFAAFVYSDSSSAPGNWWTIKVPTFASFGATCSNVLNWSTVSGFSCVNATGAMFVNFTAHQFLGNNTGSTAASSPSLIGTSDTSPNWYAAATGVAQAQVVSLTPAATALVAGLQVNFLPVANNTGANPSLAVNGLTAKSITKLGGSTNLVAGDLATTAIAVVIYDGTQWELLNPQTATGGGGGGTPCTTTAASLQYNQGGAFGCVTPFTFSGSTITAASGGILDLSGETGASAFKVPVQAGATAASDGVIDYDSTAKITHIRTNAADSLAAATTSTTTTTTQALFATAVAGVYNPRAVAVGDLPAIPWNSSANPTGNLSLTMGADTSIFNTTTAQAQMFAWKNTTAAVVGTSQGSPVLAICGRAFHGSADVEDCLTIGELPGNGNDAAITATLGHTGTSTGTFTVTAANLNGSTSVSSGTAPGCTVGTAGYWCATEGTAFTNASGTAGIYPDSTAHEFFAKTNGASAAGMIIRAQPTPINSTANTGAISTATLCAASAGACNTAGQYHISWTFIESGTACAVPATGGVTFLLTWTDTNGTTHSAVSLGMDDASAINAVSQTFHFQTSLGAAWASGDFNISTNGSVIQYATGYTACGTGTGAYQLQVVVTRAGQ